jgi:hypothetical protein
MRYWPVKPTRKEKEMKFNKDDMVMSVYEVLRSAFAGEVRMDFIDGNSIWICDMSGNRIGTVDVWSDAELENGED